MSQKWILIMSEDKFGSLIKKEEFSCWIIDLKFTFAFIRKYTTEAFPIPLFKQNCFCSSYSYYHILFRIMPLTCSFLSCPQQLTALMCGYCLSLLFSWLLLSFSLRLLTKKSLKIVQKLTSWQSLINMSSNIDLSGMPVMTSASYICASVCLSNYQQTLPFSCSESKLSTSSCVTISPKLHLMRTFGTYLSIKANTFQPNAFSLIILLIYLLSFAQSRPFNLEGNSMKISQRSVLMMLPFMVKSYNPTVERQFTCNLAVSNMGERGLGLLMNILRVEQKKLSMEPPRRITSKNYQKQYKYVAIFLSIVIFYWVCSIFSKYASMVIQLLKLVIIFRRASFAPY